MTRDDIAAVMAQIPRLTDFGMGLYLNGRGLNREEWAIEFEAGPFRLLNRESQCQALCQWLRDIRPTKTINTHQTSYYLKHLAEREIGYVTNGAFIAAALHCNFPYRLIPDSPNVLFGMSKRSIRHKEITSTRRG